MRDRGDEEKNNKVVELALVRGRKIRDAHARRKADADASTVATSLHVDITTDGKVRFPPLLVHSAQALALLKIVLAVSTHLLEVHGG